MTGLRFVSLFTGIGGIDLGLERAGMTCVAQSEIDPYASAVLAKHWPHVPNLGDITAVDWRTLDGPVDLVCGGFPCQPVSVAGKQAGEEDGRWLWPEFARAIRELRPRWVFAENVPGLLTATGGRTAQAVLGTLSELGYDAEWASVPAAAVGAPHWRYRVALVAHAHAQGSGLEVRRIPGLPERGRTLPDAEGDTRRVIDRNGFTARAHWATEPDVGRVANGVPRRVDRLRALGNAVVPQWAEAIGRMILAAEART